MSLRTLVSAVQRCHDSNNLVAPLYDSALIAVGHPGAAPSTASTMHAKRSGEQDAIVECTASAMRVGMHWRARCRRRAHWRARCRRRACSELCVAPTGSVIARERRVSVASHYPIAAMRASSSSWCHPVAPRRSLHLAPDLGVTADLDCFLSRPVMDSRSTQARISVLRACAGVSAWSATRCFASAGPHAAARRVGSASPRADRGRDSRPSHARLGARARIDK
jgi:hypothetical protein